MEVVLSGRFLTPDEALAHGLCSRVVARDALYDEAVAIATAIALRPPLAVQRAKRAVADAYETPLAEGVAREQRAFMDTFASADAAEGIAAFVEKRAPRFEGR
jgi:enoyl-CoA hydratase/carnithine racemase